MTRQLLRCYNSGKQTVLDSHFPLHRLTRCTAWEQEDSAGKVVRIRNVEALTSCCAVGANESRPARRSQVRQLTNWSLY